MIGARHAAKRAPMPIFNLVTGHPPLHFPVQTFKDFEVGKGRCVFKRIASVTYGEPKREKDSTLILGREEEFVSPS